MVVPLAVQVKLSTSASCCELTDSQPQLQRIIVEVKGTFEKLRAIWKYANLTNERKLKACVFVEVAVKSGSGVHETCRQTATR